MTPLPAVRTAMAGAGGGRRSAGATPRVTRSGSLRSVDSEPRGGRSPRDPRDRRPDFERHRRSPRLQSQKENGPSPPCAPSPTRAAPSPPPSPLPSPLPRVRRSYSRLEGGGGGAQPAGGAPPEPPPPQRAPPAPRAPPPPAPPDPSPRSPRHRPRPPRAQEEEEGDAHRRVGAGGLGRLHERAVRGGRALPPGRGVTPDPLRHLETPRGPWRPSRAQETPRRSPGEAPKTLETPRDTWRPPGPLGRPPRTHGDPPETPGDPWKPPRAQETPGDPHRTPGPPQYVRPLPSVGPFPYVR